MAHECDRVNGADDDVGVLVACACCGERTVSYGGEEERGDVKAKENLP